MLQEVIWHRLFGVPYILLKPNADEVCIMWDTLNGNLLLLALIVLIAMTVITGNISSSKPGMDNESTKTSFCLR